LAVLAAAAVPSFFLLMRSRIARVRAGPVLDAARSAIGRVPVSSQRATLAKSSGGSFVPRSRSLYAHLSRTRRISSRACGISPLASMASVPSVRASAMPRRWLGEAYGHFAAT